MIVDDRIIWSADVADDEAVLKFLGMVPSLQFTKIDRVFVERNGHGILRKLAERGAMAFYDAKFIEIPSKLEELAREAVKFRPWMVNCMAGAVSSGDMSVRENRDLMDGLKRFADVCLKAEVRPCGVTVLTSKTADVVALEYNYRTAVEQVLCYAEMLTDAGFTDLVCSPQEAEALRAEPKFDGLWLNQPGVRPAGSAAGDQARTGTPAGIVSFAKTRAVIGRPLTLANDPGEAYDAIAAEMEAALTA